MFVSCLKLACYSLNCVQVLYIWNEIGAHFSMLVMHDYDQTYYVKLSLLSLVGRLKCTSKHKGSMDDSVVCGESLLK